MPGLPVLGTDLALQRRCPKSIGYRTDHSLDHPGRSTVGNSFTGSYQNGLTGDYQGQSIVALLRHQATAITGVPLPVDSDGDTINDSLDNCTLVANPDQRDTDGDGFGNQCDPDLDNDNVVNFLDLALLKSVFFTFPQSANWNADAELNGDDAVNFIDLPQMKSVFFQAPGPGAEVP